MSDTPPTIHELPAAIVCELFEKMDLSTDDPRFWECIGLVANELSSLRESLAGVTERAERAEDNLAQERIKVRGLRDAIASMSDGLS